MTDEISEEALRQAIRAALVKPAPGFAEGETTAPAEALKHGISEYSARKMLKKLMADGVVVPTKVMYTDDWGDTQRLKGYRLIKEIET